MNEYHCACNIITIFAKTMFRSIQIAKNVDGFFIKN